MASSQFEYETPDLHHLIGLELIIGNVVCKHQFSLNLTYQFFIEFFSGFRPPKSPNPHCNYRPVTNEEAIRWFNSDRAKQFLWTIMDETTP
jgi:hypothetical protein